MVRLRHEKELRDAQTRAEADYKKAQSSESNKNITTSRYNSLAKELQDLQDRSANAQHDLEKKLRAAQDQGRTLQEEVDEAQAELQSSDRQWQHRFQELEKKHDALQKVMREVKEDLAGKTNGLLAAEGKLRDREAEAGALEAEVLSLKAASGDSDELSTVRGQLTDQVEHIRKLEISNHDMNAELRKLREASRSAAILEEEKRTLQMRLGRLDDLEKELAEANFQRQLLDDERKAWTTYLQDNAAEGQELEFDSPEAVARALRNERMEKASLLEQLGAVQPDVVEKEGIIRNLEEEKTKLKAEMTKLRAAGGSSGNSTRSQARLERQKALALKEVEYLREQLKTFEADDLTSEVSDDQDEVTKARITELESLVEQYRTELDASNSQLSTMEMPPPAAPSLKRPAPADDDDENGSAQVGELSRKARKLQHDLSASQKEHETLAADNNALRTQLAALQASARTRVLSLRNNPTDSFEDRKFSTIDLLRRENKALQAQLAGQIGSRRKGDVVPSESLEEARLETEEALAQVKSKDKSIDRLKQVFSAKSVEMREAIASLLGWNIEFVPNGRFKLTSIFANEGRHGKDKKVERHITFHGEKGTMTIAGGPEGPFGKEIRGLINYWVEERREIPGFLAAYTMENLERGREETEA